MVREENYDVVIVGCGVGGLYTALNLPSEDRILMICKEDIESCDSMLAQGGICVLRDETDYDAYFEDTMRAGHYENRKESVDIMIRSSRDVINNLLKLGVGFDKNPDGSLKYTKEGAHSQPRICFHEDITGKEITTTLQTRVKELPNVEIREYTVMTDILVEKGICTGILAKNAAGDILKLHAKDTVLATGGIGGLYKHSTNFPSLTGDGLDVAKKHGVRLEHLDYVQIHPTSLYSKKPGRSFLISESTRGEGAVLLNGKGEVQLLAKADGIIAGLQVFERVFKLLDEATETKFEVKDGDTVTKGQFLGMITGDIRVLLSGERTALNYLQRMSGIATYTNQVAKLLEGTKTTLLDTRKTTPCMRIFEKYAVKVGGGSNHRYNLSDGVMLKDNHIDAAGGVKAAVEAAKKYAPFVRKIEVETENLDMVREAVEAGADIIMLDNMTPDEMAEAIRIIDGRAETECSGNMTKENIATITKLGVDYVSSGALTHSAPILDLSLKHLRAL